jgi:hypothetical protein
LIPGAGVSMEKNVKINPVAKSAYNQHAGFEPASRNCLDSVRMTRW